MLFNDIRWNLWLRSYSTLVEVIEWKKERFLRWRQIYTKFSLIKPIIQHKLKRFCCDSRYLELCLIGCSETWKFPMYACHTKFVLLDLSSDILIYIEYWYEHNHLVMAFICTSTFLYLKMKRNDLIVICILNFCFARAYKTHHVAICLWWQVFVVFPIFLFRLFVGQII